MIEYNELIGNILLTDANGIASVKLFSFIILAFLISFAIDMIFGELPGRIHPVVIMGSIITFFRNRFISIKNRLSGLLVVLCAGFALSIIVLSIVLIVYIANAEYDFNGTICSLLMFQYQIISLI